MYRIILSTALALSLTACSTFDPYTGEKEASKTATGATIGAGVAAVLAYIGSRDDDSDVRRRRILKSAAGGAAIGGGVGYYMDSQEAKLRKQLRDTGVSVVREGNNINLIMPGNITFATDSSDIRSDFYEVLNSVVLVINEFDQTLVIVAGHTDSTGSTSYNQTLSQRRAQSVSQYFLSKNVLSDRLESVGFGENHPIADNTTAAGRQLNRRVEITLVPVTE
ncbi:OmpA family protein [Aurantivibrio plasticivorans]